MSSRSSSRFARASNDDGLTLDQWLERVNGPRSEPKSQDEGSVDRILTSLDRLSRRIKGLSQDTDVIERPRDATVERPARIETVPPQRARSTEPHLEAGAELQRAIDHIARRRDSIEAAPVRASASEAAKPALTDRMEASLAGLHQQMSDLKRMLETPQPAMAREIQDLGARVDGLARSTADQKALESLRDDVAMLREAVEESLSAVPAKALENRFEDLARRLEQLKFAIENPRQIAEVVQQSADLRRIISAMPGDAEYKALIGRVDDLARAVESALDGGPGLAAIQDQMATLAKAISSLDQTNVFVSVERRLSEVVEQIASIERRLGEGGLERLHDQTSRQTAMLSQLSQRVEQLPRLAHEMERQSIAIDGVLQATETVPRLAGDLASVRRSLDDGRTHSDRQLATLLSRIDELSDRIGQDGASDNAAVADRLVDIIERLDALRGPLDGPTTALIETHFDRLADSLTERFTSLPTGTGDTTAAGLAAQLDRIESMLGETRPADQLAAIEERLAALDAALATVDSLAPHDLQSLGDEIEGLRRDLAASTRDVAGSLETEIRQLADRIDRLPQSEGASLVRLESEIARIATLLDQRTVGGTLDEALARFEDVVQQAMNGRVEPQSGQDIAGLQKNLDRFQSDLRSGAAKDRELLLAIGEAVQRLAARELAKSEQIEPEPPMPATAAAAPTVRDAPAAPTLDSEALSAFAEIERTLSSNFARTDLRTPAAEPLAEEEEEPRAVFGRRAAGDDARQEPSFDLTDADAGGFDVNRPLEPGSGKPNRASDAPKHEEPTGEPSKADFIAAARRAAQAAANPPPADKRKGAKAGRAPEAPKADKADKAASTAPEATDAKPRNSILAGLLARRRHLAMAAAIVLIAFGASRVISSLDLGGDVAPEAELSSTTEAASPSGDPVTPAIEEPAVSVAPPTTAAETAPTSGAIPPAAMPNAEAIAPEPMGPAGQFSSAPDAPSAGTFSAIESAAATAIPSEPRPVGGGVTLPEEIGSLPLREAALAGNPAAQFEVAARYTEGRGVQQDLAAAVDWYRRAADAGLPAAQYRLGSLYEKGQGVARDAKVAADWYRRAAEAGNAKAMHNLAVIAAEGTLGEADYKLAADWFEKAANYGVRDSQFNLGILYARGLGVERDLAASYKWFAIAATGGDTDASKKRDDVAQVLDKDSLARARLAVETWTQKVPPAAANDAVPLDPSWEATPERTASTVGVDMITQAQQLLTMRGYDPGPADGKIGTRTKEAIESFQRSQGMKVTGLVDEALIRALARRSI